METLLDKKAAFTANLILDAACDLLDSTDVDALSFKKVAEQAGVSQRTMFRYFTSRNAFLDALTQKLYNQLALPDVPDNAARLCDYIAILYRQLDAQPRVVEVLLTADLLPRVLRSTAKQRLVSLNRLLRHSFPHLTEQQALKTAANLRYIMSASSWRYYKMYFEFDIDTAIECAQMVVTQSLAALEQKP